MVETRALTDSEAALVTGMFGSAIALADVTLKRRRWWPFQARDVVMAPMGHLHFHPDGECWCDCFGQQPVRMQAFFLHEMTHVWQVQHSGRWHLLLHRHPFSRYAYDWQPGKPFGSYGVEQQAEIVAHVHLMRHGVAVPGKPPLAELEAILPFGPDRRAS
jgi:hypothetical protein